MHAPVRYAVRLVITDPSDAKPSEAQTHHPTIRRHGSERSFEQAHAPW